MYHTSQPNRTRSIINKLVRVIRRVLLFAPILICSRSSLPLPLVPSMGSSTYCVKNVQTAKPAPSDLPPLRSSWYASQLQTLLSSFSSTSLLADVSVVGTAR
jgi:hypothetical protein